MTLKNIFKTTLSIILIFAMLFSIVVSTVSCNKEKEEKDYSGLKEITVFKTENFEIDGAMLRSIFVDKCTTVSNFSDYLSINWSEPLENQIVIPSAYFQALFGDIECEGKTWLDILWDDTEKEAKDLLAFCEAAKADGFELSSEEISKIDENIKKILEKETHFFERTFGYGITNEDVRKVLLLMSLRDKYIAEESDSILSGITDGDVEAYFKDNEEKYTTDDMYIKTKEFAHIIVRDYADDESKPAKAEAERILEEFLGGDMSRDIFETLSKEKNEYAKKNILISVSPITGVSFSTKSPLLYSILGGNFATINGYVVPMGGVEPGSMLTLPENITEREGFYDNVRPDDVEQELAEWLFDEARKENDVEIIVRLTEVSDKSSSLQTVPGYEYHVMWFIGEGEEIWFLDSKNDYYQKLISEWQDQVFDTAGITYLDVKDIKNKVDN